MDDAYLGGERCGGKPERESENKVAIVAAASVDEAGHPQYVKLAPWPPSPLPPSQTVPKMLWRQVVR